MKITIEGDPKEIADLAMEMQERLNSESLDFTGITDHLSSGIQDALTTTCDTSSGSRQETFEIRKPYSGENATITLPKCAEDEIPVLIRKPYSDKITVFVARKVSKHH